MTIRRAGTRLPRTLLHIICVRGGQERLPLALDAALALGCCAAVGADARARPLTEGFDRAELEARRFTPRSHKTPENTFVLSVFAPRSRMPPIKMAVVVTMPAVMPGPLAQA
jgi:hypothetical protein